MENHLVACRVGRLIRRMTLEDDFPYFESLSLGQTSPPLGIPNPSGTVEQIGKKERHPPHLPRRI